MRLLVTKKSQLCGRLRLLSQENWMASSLQLFTSTQQVRIAQSLQGHLISESNERCWKPCSHKQQPFLCFSHYMLWHAATMVWYWQGDAVEVCIVRLITALRSQHRGTTPLPGGRVDYWRVCRVSMHDLTPGGMVTPSTCTSPALLALPSCLQNYSQV